MRKLLREYVKEILNEIGWDQEMLDLYKEKMGKKNVPNALDALHMWMWNTGLLHEVGNDLALNLKEISQEEYESLKRYTVSRFEGLRRQYRRSKDPVQSALSAINYYLSSFYEKQIVGGRVRRRVHGRSSGEARTSEEPMSDDME